MTSVDTSIRLPKLFQHGLPTSACLIERVSDRLIYFSKWLSRTRLGRFELLKYCRIFKHRSHIDFVSSIELKCCRISNINNRRSLRVVSELKCFSDFHYRTN